MNTALVPVVAGRPVFVRLPGADVVTRLHDRITVGRHGDVSVCVSIHDTYFLRTKAAYRAETLAAAQRPGRLVGVIESYRRWLTRERAWYASVGLSLPDWQASTRTRPRYRMNLLGARRPDRETCPQGHAMDAGNTYRGGLGHRKCRACNRARMRGAAR